MHLLQNQKKEETFDEENKSFIRRIYLELYALDKRIHQCTYLNHLALRFKGYFLMYIDTKGSFYFRNSDETVSWIKSRYPWIKIEQDESLNYQWIRVTDASLAEFVLISMKSMHCLYKMVKK